MNFSKDVYEFNQKMRYEKMSTAELRAAARRDGIKDCDKMSKEELLCKLWDFDNFDDFEDFYYDDFYTMVELRDEARSKGLLDNYRISKMRRAELIELVENNKYEYYMIEGDIYERCLTEDGDDDWCLVDPEGYEFSLQLKLYEDTVEPSKLNMKRLLPLGV